MRIAYLDCASGISGDMTLGALVDAGVPLELLNERIQSLGLPSVVIVAQEVKKNGFRATQITIQHEPQTQHRHLHHIVKMIEGSSLLPQERARALAVFQHLAEAEAKVHGTTVQKVHFHEVGAIDSICDIVASCVGWEWLGIERGVSAPIPTGTGTIEIAHGRCSVPAPATAELLRGIPLAASEIPFELTTPTGAALVRTLVSEFAGFPAMTIERIGLGAGMRDLPSQPNLLRILIGQAANESTGELVWLLETNLDNISAEVLGYAIERLWQTGAVDVFTTAIQMKKQRPGILLSVLCAADRIAEVEQVLFTETPTLGIRRLPCRRTTLPRQAIQVRTEYGEVAGIVAQTPGGPRFAPEYEACRQLAEAQRIPLHVVQEAARRAWSPG